MFYIVEVLFDNLFLWDAKIIEDDVETLPDRKTLTGSHVNARIGWQVRHSKVRARQRSSEAKNSREKHNRSGEKRFRGSFIFSVLLTVQ